MKFIIILKTFLLPTFLDPSMNFCNGKTNDNTITTKYFTVKLDKKEAKDLPSEVTIGIRPEKTQIKKSKEKTRTKFKL